MTAKDRHGEHTMNRLLRRPEVERMTGLSRSTIYLLLSSGAFPKPVNIGPRAVAWVETEIAEWVQSRISERDQSPA